MLQLKPLESYHVESYGIFIWQSLVKNDIMIRYVLIDPNSCSDPLPVQVLMWTMGESLLGPSQILHALKICQEAVQLHAAADQQKMGLSPCHDHYDTLTSQIITVYLFYTTATVICIDNLIYSDHLKRSFKHTTEQHNCI